MSDDDKQPDAKVPDRETAKRYDEKLSEATESLEAPSAGGPAV